MNTYQPTNQRTPSSCRFAEYWKVQWRDEANYAWRDIQKKHFTIEAAQAAAAGYQQKHGCAARLISITMTGRQAVA